MRKNTFLDLVKGKRTENDIRALFLLSISKYSPDDPANKLFWEGVRLEIIREGATPLLVVSFTHPVTRKEVKFSV